MPLTTEQTAAIASALTIEGADAKEIAEAIKASASSVYQTVFQAGHSTATKDGKAKLTQKDEELAALTTELDAAKAEATRLAAANPDHAAEKKKLEERLAALTTERDDAKRSAAEEITKFRRTAELARVEAALVAKNNVPEWVSNVTVPANSARVRVEEDGSVTYLDVDGQTPLTSGFEGFVSQLDASIAPDYKRSGASGGSGLNGAGGKGTKYDAAAVGKEMGQRQKIGAEALNGLAFK